MPHTPARDSKDRESQLRHQQAKLTAIIITEFLLQQGIGTPVFGSLDNLRSGIIFPSLYLKPTPRTALRAFVTSICYSSSSKRPPSSSIALHTNLNVVLWRNMTTISSYIFIVTIPWPQDTSSFRPYDPADALLFAALLLLVSIVNVPAAPPPFACSSANAFGSTPL